MRMKRVRGLGGKELGRCSGAPCVSTRLSRRTKVHGKTCLSHYLHHPVARGEVYKVRGYRGRQKTGKLNLQGGGAMGRCLHSHTFCTRGKDSSFGTSTRDKRISSVSIEPLFLFPRLFSIPFTSLLYIYIYLYIYHLWNDQEQFHLSFMGRESSFTKTETRPRVAEYSVHIGSAR